MLNLKLIWQKAGATSKAVSRQGVLEAEAQLKRAQSSVGS